MLIGHSTVSLAQETTLKLGIVKSYPAAFWAFANRAGFPRNSTGQQMIRLSFKEDSAAMAHEIPSIKRVMDSASEQYLNGPGKDADLGSFSFTEKFTQLAVQSPDIEKLYGHVQRVIEGKNGKELVESLRAIEPLYRRRIWEPLEARLDSQIAVLNRKVDSANLSYCLNLAAMFFGTDLTGLNHFDIVLNPLPPEVRFTSGTPYDTLLFCDISSREKDYASLLGVAVHEMCHVLWRHRTDASKARWKQAYLTDAGRMTFSWLDEGLASAIGNGIVYKNLTGHVEKGPWYDDPIIDTFARSIAPGVEGYFLSKAPADLLLMTQFQRLFLREFPDFRRRPEILFPYADILAPDRESMEQFYAECGKKFTLRATRSGYPISIEELAAVNQDTVPGTRVVIVANKAEAIKIDKALGLKENMAQKALVLARPAKATSLSNWPLILIPMRNGKLMLDVSKKL